MRRIVFYFFTAGLLLSWGPPQAQAQALPEDGAAQSILDAAPVKAPRGDLEDAPTHPPITEPLSLRLNIPAARLDFYRTGQLVKSYPVAIGMPRYPTPLRDYNISMIIWNPWWIPPETEWAKDAEKTPPGPGNPLGVVKLIMEDEVRIHGTNQSSSIGRAISHACIRMRNADAKELAWEIQNRYSEKTDPTLLETYQRHRRTSYYVQLFETVSVAVEYRQVERKEDHLLLHPNRYGREGFAEELAAALWDQPDVVIDKALIKRLNKLRARKTVQISLADILTWAKPAPASGAPPAAPVSG